MICVPAIQLLHRCFHIQQRRIGVDVLRQSWVRVPHELRRDSHIHFRYRQMCAEGFPQALTVDLTVLIIIDDLRSDKVRFPSSESW